MTSMWIPGATADRNVVRGSSSAAHARQHDKAIVVLPELPELPRDG